MSAQLHAQRAVNRATDMEYHAAAGNVIAAMEALAACNRAIVDVATALVEAGVREGLSQAAMSRALEVPASALRGARKEFARD